MTFLNHSFCNQIKQKIHEKNISICVVGIGRIGLPTCLKFAHAGFKTIGIDIDQKLVDAINSKNYPMKDEPHFDVIFDEVISKNKFRATTKIEEINNCEIIILALPNHIKNNDLNNSPLLKIAKQLNLLLKLNSIVIVESTVEPKFVEEKLIPIIENDGTRLKLDKSFGVVVCPEFANPGQIFEDFNKVPRMIGSNNKKTIEIVTSLYNSVFDVEIISLPDFNTVNIAKIVMNYYRYINIAIVNDLSLLFEKIGIDIKKVLCACEKKYNFEMHYPSAGVGGPCLPTNILQMMKIADDSQYSLKLASVAMEINQNMPDHVISLVVDAFREANKNISGSQITILGLSYKPNVKDIQLTPAKPIIEKLLKLGAIIKTFDPYFIDVSLFTLKTEKTLNDAIQNADALIIVTSHNIFLNQDFNELVSKMNPNPILVDTTWTTNEGDIEGNDIIYRGIGRTKNTS